MDVGQIIALLFGLALVIAVVGAFLDERRKDKRKMMADVLNRQRNVSSKDRATEIAGAVAGSAAAQVAAQDRTTLAMARVKCVNCGAGIEEGQLFCSHCGTKIPDDTFKAQIQIDDEAEKLRVEYEKMESKLRQKKMKKDLRRGRIAWILIGIVAAFGAWVVLYGILKRTPEGNADGFVIFFGIVTLLSAFVLALIQAFRD